MPSAPSAIDGRDPLPSWNQGSAKVDIIRFVRDVTDQSSPKFVRPEDRIACFDNDGTLWCEKPIAPQIAFIIDGLRARAATDRSLRDTQPYKAALEGDLPYFEALGVPGLLAIALGAWSDITQVEFEDQVKAFIASASHPRFRVPYFQVAYRPMVELIQYLQLAGFKVHIVSAGGISFIRTFSRNVYGVAPEQVIGSSVKIRFEYRADGPTFVREAALLGPINDGPLKPVSVELHVGKFPLIACGNSQGDLELLQSADVRGRPSLLMLLRHDDAAREYAYEACSDEMLELARQRGWMVVSMKNDFKTLFPGAGR